MVYPTVMYMVMCPTNDCNRTAEKTENGKCASLNCCCADAHRAAEDIHLTLPSSNPPRGTVITWLNLVSAQDKGMPKFSRALHEVGGWVCYNHAKAKITHPSIGGQHP
jgi:hypothetical protein|mmetsp:Transcript_17328/g.30013  ORF Transcript_17328/g.30013 Transcript_17328/m.30013 type:complete len:108 (+) Transcript_17328:218-541(+)